MTTTQCAFLIFLRQLTGTNQGIFNIWLPRMILTLASQNLRRGHRVDIRLDSIKYACFIRCPSTSGVPSSHGVCLDSEQFAAKSHRIPCGLRGPSGTPWASELIFFITLKCGLARFPWLDAGGP